MDPLKEPLKGTLIDPFKGNAGFIASTVLRPCLLRQEAFEKIGAVEQQALWAD